MSSIEEVSKVV